MLTLFDQEVAERLHVASAVREAVEKNTVEVDRAARLDSIKSLMKTMNLSPADAMAALSIPPAQQAIYIEQL